MEEVIHYKMAQENISTKDRVAKLFKEWDVRILLIKSIKYIFIIYYKIIYVNNRY